MKGLFLCGMYCTSEIFHKMRENFSVMDIDYLDYPHKITRKAKSVEELAFFLSSILRDKTYDFVAGHSMGGLIALILCAKHGLKCKKIILIESNLKPANPFYRNLMTPEHMETHGPQALHMMREEAPFYLEELKKSLQEDFDFTPYVMEAKQELHAIYGDRGQKGYENRISDLCLPESVAGKLRFSFVENACHMPMIENPEGLAHVLQKIIRKE